MNIKSMDRSEQMMEIMASTNIIWGSSEDIEVRLEVRLEVRIEIRIEVRIEVRLELLSWPLRRDL